MPSLADRSEPAHGSSSRAAPGGPPGAFGAFRHANYRLLFLGQLGSLIGTWMQSVAQGWLVRELTPAGERALWLGMIGFLGSMPMLVLLPLGGVVADRAPRRRLLMAYQLLAVIPPLVLASLTITGAVRVWQIALIAALLSAINAFEVPARQAFFIEVVGKEDLLSAIALNASIYNGARLLGPAVAGLVMAAFASERLGHSVCFFLNALSFAAALVTLASMRRLRPPPERQPASVATDLGEAVRYVARTRRVLALMILAGVVSLWGWMFSTLLPLFAADVLRLGSRGYSFLVSASGVGALTGALTLASLVNRVARRRLLVAAIASYCISVSVFASSLRPWLSALALIGLGWGLVLFFATTNAAVQRGLPDRLRGRVLSIYVLITSGFASLGSLLAGWLSDRLGEPRAVLYAGAAACGLALLVLLRRIEDERE